MAQKVLLHSRDATLPAAQLLPLPRTSGTRHPKQSIYLYRLYMQARGELWLELGRISVSAAVALPKTSRAHDSCRLCAHTCDSGNVRRVYLCLYLSPYDCSAQDVQRSVFSTQSSRKPGQFSSQSYSQECLICLLANSDRSMATRPWLNGINGPRSSRTKDLDTSHSTFF